MNKKIEIFPGSFDPFTKGHAHIVEKALEIFDEVIIFVASNPNKKRMFDVRAMGSIIEEKYHNLEMEGRIHVCTQQNSLVVDVAKMHGAKFIVKGIRNATDADYELSQAEANKWLGELQTVLIPCDKEYSHISSTLVRSLLSVTGENSEMAREKANELM